TDPTTSSTAYTSPITISETTTLKFFSVDNAENSEAVKTETYTINTMPESILFNEKIKLKNAELDQTYESNTGNIKLIFSKLPKAKAINKLYLKFTRNKKKYNSSFLKSKSYPGHLLLTSNIGLVKKAYAKKVNKRVGLKLTINYSQNKIKKLKLKEKNLRIFFQINDGVWAGPYKVKQNKTSNTIKFGIRNYLKKSKESLKTFYFQDLTKIKFILAEKGALNQLQKRILF
ncbi:MAG: chitobiase/beta-hexosaminidase C-terminal domain-containing protein, partial [Patescibacteria group bacterium]|nr:chitobiase/beta-hexosaminidase C-terminal domain-containing protein [Patescibacteria group bacterium]